jgi:hypothetical protein
MCFKNKAEDTYFITIPCKRTLPLKTEQEFPFSEHVGEPNQIWQVTAQSLTERRKGWLKIKWVQKKMGHENKLVNLSITK